MERGNPDRRDVLEKRFGNLPIGTRYFANADEATFRSIEGGVFFFMAFWSGTSYQSLRRLIDTLTESADVPCELVIVDVDGSESLYLLPEFRAFSPVFGGNGETAWLRRLKVVAMTWGTSDRQEDYRKNLELSASLE